MSHARRALGLTGTAALAVLALAALLPPRAAPGADSLYDRLGGAAGVEAIVDGLRARNAREPVTARRLAGANGALIRKGLIEVLTERAGGPLAYRGPSMREAHRGMGLTDAEYDAFMRNFEGALDDRPLAKADRIAALGIFESLRGEIVEPRAPAAAGAGAAGLDRQVLALERRLVEIERKLDILLAGGPHGRAATATATAAPAMGGAAPAMSGATPTSGGAPPAPSGPTASALSDAERALVPGLVRRYASGRNTGSGAGSGASAGAGAGGEPHPELIGRPLEHHRFVLPSGDVLDLRDLEGKKRVVLVIMRGFAGTVCIHCSTQTLSIADALPELRRRDAEPVLVYPGRADTLPRFVEAVKSLRQGFTPDLKIVLDVDLLAVRTFRIEGRLAKPTTIIVDESGVVRWAYVGMQPADRPSAAEVIEALDAIPRAGTR